MPHLETPQVVLPYYVKPFFVHLQVMPIVNKCQVSIQSAMEEINPEKDTDIVIEKYKSGDVPPADFNSAFGEMSDPRSMLDNDPIAQTGNKVI